MNSFGANKVCMAFALYIKIIQPAMMISILSYAMYLGPSSCLLIYT